VERTKRVADGLDLFILELQVQVLPLTVNTSLSAEANSQPYIFSMAKPGPDSDFR
jgi:hypothetical protein